MATIAQNLAALRQAKTDIASAITTKGGTVAQGDGLSDFATDISTIPSGVDTSNDTVTPATLAEGMTAHNAAGQQITGTAIIPTQCVLQGDIGTGYAYIVNTLNATYVYGYFKPSSSLPTIIYYPENFQPEFSTGGGQSGYEKERSKPVSAYMYKEKRQIVINGGTSARDYRHFFAVFI